MDWLYEQMEATTPVTNKNLSEMKIKTFASGRSIQIGDFVFYGLRLDDNNEADAVQLEMITFHKDEINKKYTIVNKSISQGRMSPFPILKIID